MKIAITFFLLLMAFPSVGQDFVKKINVLVKDEQTGNPVANVQVSFKGLIANRKKTTDATGSAKFEFVFIADKQQVTVEVVDQNFIKRYKPFTTSINITKEVSSYELPIILSVTGYKHVNVTVTEENGNPVVSALVDIRDDAKPTNNNGFIGFNIALIESTKDVPVTVTKEGYKTFSTKIKLIESQQEYPVPVILKRVSSDFKAVNFHVTASDDSKPVIGAHIAAVGHGLTNTFTGTTDDNGNATVIFKSSGDFEVTIKHEAFFPEVQTLNIQHLDEDKNYSPGVVLRRRTQKTEGTIEVLVKDIDGNPLNNAFISITGTGQGFTSTTNSKGIAKVQHQYLQGDILNVKASKEGYKSQEQNVMVGTNQRREGAVVVPNDNTSFVLQKGTKGKLQFVAQVLDSKTNKPINLANAVIKSYEGKAVSQEVKTNTNGEASLYVDEAALISGQFRLIASAHDYEEKWSDISPDLLQSNFGKRYLQIYLKPKKSPKDSREKYYGLFKVNLSAWVPTGVHVKKGSTFRVETTGVLINENAGTGVSKEVTPDGYGHWGWYVLAVRIGKNVIPVGSKGIGTAPEEGDIELGAPRSQNIFPEDAKGTTGDWKVKLYATDAEEFPIFDSKASKANRDEKVKRAKTDLEFLKLLLSGQNLPNKEPEQIALEVKAIASNYNINTLQDLGDCITTIKHYHESFYNREITEKEKQLYASCISQLIHQLNIWIEIQERGQ